VKAGSPGQVPMPSPGGQVSGMAGQGAVSPAGSAVVCGIPSTSQRATTRRPGGRAGRGMVECCRGLPPSRRVVGLRQVDGMPHWPTCGEVPGSSWFVSRSSGPTAPKYSTRDSQARSHRTAGPPLTCHTRPYATQAAMSSHHGRRSGVTAIDLSSAPSSSPGCPSSLSSSALSASRN